MLLFVCNLRTQKMQETLLPPSHKRSENSERAASTELIGPSMKVLSWEHIPENGEIAAKAVEDCGVLAVEITGFRSERDRSDYDDAATMFVSPTTSETDRAKAQKYLQYYSPPEIISLLKALEGTGKRIVTIDVNKNEPGSEQYSRGRRIFEKAQKNIHRVTSDKTKELLHNAGNITARASIEREAKVIDQLQDLAAQYKDTDTKIGVLVGATHTPTLLRELTPLYSIERRFALGRHTGQQPRERLYFTPDDQMSGHYKFVPGVMASEGLADRTVLHTTQQAAWRRGVATNNIVRARRLEDVSDAEVSDIVLALDGMKSGLRARLRPKRTLAKMDAAIEAKLTEIEGKNTHTS